jgi:hypothetical protein
MRRTEKPGAARTSVEDGMTHDQIVAALRRDYQLVDARESRRNCYPIRKPAPRTTVRRRWDDPLGSDTPDPTGFAEGCVI